MTVTNRIPVLKCKIIMIEVGNKQPVLSLSYTL